MIGTWRLVEFRFTDADGNPGRPEDGPKLGRMEYTADGHMATATRQADETKFSYIGEFEIDGTANRRNAPFDGARLVLTANPSMLGEPGSKASLIWERITQPVSQT